MAVLTAAKHFKDINVSELQDDFTILAIAR